MRGLRVLDGADVPRVVAGVDPGVPEDVSGDARAVDRAEQMVRPSALRVGHGVQQDPG